MSRKRALAGLAVGAAAVIFGGALWRLRHRDSSTLPQPSATAGAPAWQRPARYEVAMPILVDALAPGWEDRGWGKHSPVTSGGIGVDFNSYGGITLYHPVLSDWFGALVFRYQVPAGSEDFLEVTLQGQPLAEDAFAPVPLESKYLARTADGWQEAFIPWSVLNPGNRRFDRIQIKARRNVTLDPVTVNHVLLTKPERGVAPVRKAKLAIRCDKPSLAINPLIYGIAAGVFESGETAHRIGGNAMSRHNWDLGAWNAGSDWFFENTKVSSGLAEWLSENRTRKVKTALVVPMLGWVAKDGTSVGFPAAKFRGQRKYDPNRPEAGDGFRSDGSPLAPGPPEQTSVAAPPELIGRWIADIVKRDGESGHRSVDMYILDNEPALWHKTHRDVHPQPVTYDELLDRTLRYGTAIRNADPGAVIAGPAAWGWSEYFYSAKDTEVSWLLQPDRNAHEGVPLLPWYLGQLAEHERRTGKRILDVVDVHFYPQAQGVYGGDSHTDRIDPETAALRIRSTRALWDPSYRDESWIKEHVKLIPRMKAWIAQAYPGRGLSLGEWSFGAEGHISGALAIAEALGRFGQQGLTAAFYWRRLDQETPAYQAFRAFRNFDGKGATFLAASTPTDEAPNVSLFASREEGRDHVVAIALNLDPSFAAEAQIDVGSCGVVSTRRAFAYGPGMRELAEQPGGSGADAKELTELIPPYSLKVLDLTFQR